MELKLRQVTAGADGYGRQWIWTDESLALLRSFDAVRLDRVFVKAVKPTPGTVDGHVGIRIGDRQYVHAHLEDLLKGLLVRAVVNDKDDVSAWLIDCTPEMTFEVWFTASAAGK